MAKIFCLDDNRLVFILFTSGLHTILYFTGMLVYFLYGIHHSKEGDCISSYSILMTSSEAVKEKWGATTKTNYLKGAFTRRKTSLGSKTGIVGEEESTE